MAMVAKSGSLTLYESRISYLEWGSGKRSVLLLHGNPGRKSDFDQLGELLATAGCRCLAPDRPGHGNSEELIPEQPDPWLDASVYADMIAEKLHGSAIVIGYSLGAFLACKIAVKFPERVQKIALVAPFVQPNSASEKPSSLPEWAKNPLIGTVFGLLLPTLSTGKLQTHLTNVWQPQNMPVEVLERELNWYSKFESLMAVFADKNAMLTTFGETHRLLADVAAPIFVVAGKADAVCDAQAQCARITESNSRAQVAWLEQAGHGLPFTHPRETAELLIEHVINPE